MNLERIVVGTDLSDEANVALEHAIAIARRVGAEIVLVNARPVIELGSKLSSSYSTLAELHQTASREGMARLRERHSGQGVEISHVLVDGFADTALEKAAAELGAGLICVGTHGRTGLKRFLLGSVAERVVRISDRDVLVARGGHSRGGYSRILVPTDFSPLAERALRHAIGLASDDATIDLFHCRQQPIPISATYYPVGEPALRELDAELTAAAAESAKVLIERYSRDGLELRYDTIDMPPAEAIIERAPGYDLIAVGSHGRRGVRRLILGSVAEVTVRHAPCSVLVAHAPVDGGD